MRWTCSALILGGTLLPQPLLVSSGMQETYEAWLAVETEGKNSLSTLVFSTSEASFPFSLFRRDTLSFASLLWTMYLKKPFLLFFKFLAKLNSICALIFLIPSLHILTASLYSSQATYPQSHSLHISFLSLSLTSRSFISPAGFLPRLPVFLFWGMASSCESSCAHAFIYTSSYSCSTFLLVYLMLIAQILYKRHDQSVLGNSSEGNHGP